MMSKSPFAGLNPNRVSNLPNMGRVQNAFQMIFNSQNPMQAMQKAFANTPQFAQMNNLLRQGKNPEQLFRQMAQQRGIDPDEFIRAMIADPNGNNGR